MLLGLAVWVFFNRTYVVDRITVWRFTPSAEVREVAKQSAMSDAGIFLFYASRPSIEPAATFNTHCQQHEEKTAILGCYVNHQIYLYDVTDERLHGIKEVTAAHEMLHAAYERMDTRQQAQVNALIDEAMKTIHDDSLQKRLAVYDKTEPGERYNELHSMLGSEVKDLPAALESHYEEYFTNRLTVVDEFTRYESVFTQLENQQTQLVSDLNGLASTINARSQTYNANFSALLADIDAFNKRADSGEFASQSAFNRERAALVSRQSALSAERESLQALITEYDSKKKALDVLNLQAEGLQRSIDSTALPEVPTLSQ